MFYRKLLKLLLGGNVLIHKVSNYDPHSVNVGLISRSVVFCFNEPILEIMKFLILTLRECASCTPLPSLKKAAHSCFETQRRCYQKSKTGVSVAPSKDMFHQIFLKKQHSRLVNLIYFDGHQMSVLVQGWALCSEVQ